MARSKLGSGLKSALSAPDPQMERTPAADLPASVLQARRGRRPTGQEGPRLRETREALIAYFPPEVKQELRVMAARDNTTIQALVGEALDLLRRDRGLHPFGAR